MDITLTPTELEMLTASATLGEDVPTTFHRLMFPMLQAYGETRLQMLANEYRQMTPDLQSAAIQVLKTWQATVLPQVKP